MPIHRDRALCLRNIEYSETSQIVTLFGRRTGMFRTIAKGAHRRTKAGASKFDGGIDLLDVGDCVFIDHANRDLGTLTEWKQLSGQLSLHRSLRGMLLGQVLAEVLPSLLAEHDPHPELFDRLRATLPVLSTDRVEEHFVALLADVLSMAGYLPDLNACAQCDQPLAGFAASTPVRPGLLCRNCADAYPNRRELDPRLFRIVTTLLSLPRERGVAQRLPRLTRHQSDPLIDFFLGQIEQVSQRPLRTRAFLDDVG
ncbi:MAG TPA: DNA repair protein RecO [Tepidisphaeraceae bacterium]|jgi:DNA repair protein RecO